MKARFIEVFESEPKNLNHLASGFKESSLTSKKAGQLSGINIEAMESVFADNKDVQVEIDLDEITVSSTAQGCIALDKVALEKIPGTSMKVIRCPVIFLTAIYFMPIMKPHMYM